MSVDGAVKLLKEFIARNDIDTLNVAGIRASEDGLIYEKTDQVIEGALGR